MDGDPVFSALMDGMAPEHGFWAIEMEDVKAIDQAYVRNTPVLRTVMTAEDGSSAEIIDFAPRHPKHSRTYRPLAFARIVRPLSEAVRVARAVVPGLKTAGRATIICLGSYAGHSIGWPGHLAYSSAKAGITSTEQTVSLSSASTAAW